LSAASVSAASSSALVSAASAATCEQLFSQIEPKVFYQYTTLTSPNNTFFNSNVVLTDGLSNQLVLNNQADSTSTFYNNLQVNGQVFTNKITGSGDVFGDAQPLIIGDTISSSNLILSAKKSVIVSSPNTIYMNANGNIIIESPSSIIIRSPTIVFDGQVTNTNVTGINLGNYNAV